MLVRPHVSFVISPPAAQMFWSTPKARQRFLTRRRTKALRQRKNDAKKSKGNQRRCYRVWMSDVDVLALLDDVKLAQQRDDQFSPRELRAAFDREWIEVAGRVIEQAALLAIKKNRK